MATTASGLPGAGGYLGGRALRQATGVLSAFANAQCRNACVIKGFERLEGLVEGFGRRKHQWRGVWSDGIFNQGSLSVMAVCLCDCWWCVVSCL